MDSNPPITLLIVDDEPEIRSGLRSLLPWEQYSISVIGMASNGIDALNKIRFYEPDIVITDIQMPGMDGLELVRRTKEEQFDCSFVILSGYDDFQYAKSAIKYGVCDYLLKPISIKEFTELLQRLIDDISKRRLLHSDQMSTLRKLRKAQVSIRQHNLVPQLLHNELTANELHKAIEDYNLPIHDIKSCVVLIQAFESLHGDEDSLMIHQNLLSLQEQIESELKGHLLISQLPLSSFLLVINLSPDETALYTLKHFFTQWLSDYSSGSFVQFVAAIGKSVDSLLDISVSYQSARHIINWHIYPEFGRVLDSEMFLSNQPPILMPGEGIWDAILKNDFSAIRNEFLQYFTQLLNDSTPPPSYLYSMCNYLIITVQNQMSQYLGGKPQSFTGNTYAVLQNLATLDDIRNWMSEILCDFACELQISRATQNDPLIERAISYIHQNFLKNPRTEDICSYLGLSKSYFSTYFKNKVHLTFREYMLNLKISYAQERLKHPEHTPGEVALLLGYEDYRSFSRVFKSRTGFSPSDYQKQYTTDERN